MVVWQSGIKRIKVMLKKTTIYLEEDELKKLKAASFMLNTSMTDLIRQGVQCFYDSMPKEQEKALKALSSVKINCSEEKIKKVTASKTGNKRKK
jgi:hypothetical protein